MTVFLFLLSAIGLAGQIVEAGSVVEVTQAEAVNLLNRKKARLATSEDDPEVPEGNGGGLREDGPTVEEFVAAGYSATNYPPEGYASRSTDEEILAAIEAEEAKETAE